MSTAEVRLARQVKTAKAIDEAHAHADRVLAKARKARIPRPPAPGRTGEQRREDHAASTGTIREQVFERCGGKCEVSGVELGVAWELHHLDGGGHRRSRQSLDNCLAVSWDVHRLIHRGDMATLRNVKETCLRLGLRDGLRAIEKRIANVENAREAACRIARSRV